jgi:hypothetical protein
MGWLSAIGAMFAGGTGEGIAASLVRVVIGIGLMRYLNKDKTVPDRVTPAGSRVQIAPATENKIPVAYGSSYFGGTVIDVQLTNENKEMVAVIALCETTGTIHSSGTDSQIVIDDIYLDNNRITFKADGTTIDYTTDETGVKDTNSNALVGIYLYNGSSNDPMLPCATGTTTAITGTLPPAAYSIMPGWGSSHTCENIVFAVVKLNYDPSKGQHSIPNLKFHVVNSMNQPGDVLYDYMTNELYGAGIDTTLININSLESLNAYSNETVVYAPYSPQPRYRINGLVQTNNNVVSNMEKIVGACGSNITYDISTGQWSVISNRLTTKTLDFNDSNIIGQIAVTGTNLDSFYNSVEVQFPYSYLKDQSNFIRIDLPTIYRNANEPDNMLQIDHDLVNNVVQASLIGNLELRQSREDISVTFKTDFSKFNVQVGDVFGLTNSVYGWTGKLFKVIRVVKNESDVGELTLDITGLSYNDDVYTVEDISDFIPLIGAGHSIPSLAAINTPIVPTIASSTLSSQPSITITGTVPAGVVTEMEYWYTGDTASDDNVRNYTLLGTMRSKNSGPFTTGVTSTFKTVLLSSGTYRFKVRAANASGSSKFSPPSDALSYEYKQAPDVLPYNAPTVDSSGASAAAGLSLGLIAMYIASKLNWGDIASKTAEELGSLFGAPPDAVAAAQAAVASDVTGGVSAGEGVNVASNGQLSLDPAVVATMSGAGCTLTLGSDKYPADRSTSENPEANTSGDRAASTGAYYFTVNLGDAALTPGTGKAKLYKSNGALVQSVAASAMAIEGNKVTIPFNDRTIGTDYYILLDRNVVNDGSCQSIAVTTPLVWNFHTADPQDAVQPTPTPPPAPVLKECPPVKFVKLKSYLSSKYVAANANKGTPLKTGKIALSPDNLLVDVESNIGLEFNQPIAFNTTGTITINSNTGVYQTFNIASSFLNGKVSELFWIEGNTIWLNATTDYTKGKTYWVTMTSNCVRNSCNTSNNEQISGSTAATFTIDPGPTAKPVTENGAALKPAANDGIVLKYDRPIQLSTDANVAITDTSGTNIKQVTADDPTISTKEG